MAQMFLLYTCCCIARSYDVFILPQVGMLRFDWLIQVEDFSIHHFQKWVLSTGTVHDSPKGASRRGHGHNWVKKG